MELELFENENNVNLQTFAHQLKNYVMQMKKPKYDLILEFLNSIFDMKIESLKQFKNYDLDNVDKNKFSSTLKIYQSKLEEKLEVKLSDKKDFLKVLQECLHKIDYSVHIDRIVDNHTGYTKMILSITNIPKKEYEPVNHIIPEKVKNIKKDIVTEIKEHQQKRKDVILRFINDIFGKKYKSLSRIKNLNVSKIDKKEFKNMVEEYEEEFSEFKINIDIELGYLTVLKDCIRSVGYFVKQEKKDSEILLSVNRK